MEDILERAIWSAPSSSLDFWWMSNGLMGLPAPGDIVQSRTSWFMSSWILKWIYALNKLATHVNVNIDSQVIKVRRKQCVDPRERKMQIIQVNYILTDVSTGYFEWMTWPTIFSRKTPKRYSTCTFLREGQESWFYFKR